MASKTAATKPKQDFNAIGQLARKALLLAEAHAVAIGDRLPAGFTKRLADDVANLDRAVPAAMNSKDGRIQLTAAQTTALAWGHSVVMAIRAAVKSEEPDRDVLLAFGVGTRVNRRVVKDVKAALEKIIDRLAAQPGDVQRFDIVQDDVDGLTASLALIETADRDQEAGRAGGPQATRDRNAVARRVLKGVKKIAGAGMRAFTRDLGVYAAFAALISSRVD